MRVRDTKLKEIDCENIICDLSELSLNDFNKILNWINDKFKYNIDVLYKFNNSNLYKKIQASLLSIQYEESIEYLFPESKDLWDYKKNYPFKPSHFTKGSHTEAWVNCGNGHSWKRELKNLFRTIKGKKHIMKCPECYKSNTITE